MIERESLLVQGARAATSSGLKGLDHLLRKNSFRGFGGLIIGGFVMQFDYRRLGRKRSNKIAKISMDNADGDDLSIKGRKPEEISIDCWFSGPLKNVYKQALIEIDLSQKVQTFFSREVSLEVIIEDIDFTHENTEEIRWTMKLLEFVDFPAIVQGKNIFNIVADVTASAGTTIESLVLL